MIQHGACRYGIDRHWCDSSGIYLEGWVRHDQADIEVLRILGAEQVCELRSFLPYPDPGEGEATGGPGRASGFRAYLPWRASDQLEFQVVAGAETMRFPVELPAGGIPSEPWSHASPAPPQADIFGAAELDVAFRAAVDEANAKAFTVCEVGSRNVSPGATTKRTLFPSAARYIGVDVHAADNVDVAGDAHFLHELLGEASVDLVFSIAVMEHLSFPWLFAAAVNRTLRPGGLTFHMTHQTWPIHEQPNDFWRFSDQALRVLFGPEMGFETVYAGMHDRTYIYPEERRESFATVSFAPCYSHVFVLARKVREIAPDAVRWPVAREAAGLLASQYPRPPGQPAPPAAPAQATRLAEADPEPKADRDGEASPDPVLEEALRRAGIAEARAAALAGRLEAIEDSTIWRATGSLRHLVNAVRRSRD